MTTQFQKPHYEARGDEIVHVSHIGETDVRARCATSRYAEDAARLLNLSGDLNDRRKYSASARKMAEAECLPGFEWIEPGART